MNTAGKNEAQMKTIREKDKTGNQTWYTAQERYINKVKQEVATKTETRHRGMWG